MFSIGERPRLSFLFGVESQSLADLHTDARRAGGSAEAVSQVPHRCPEQSQDRRRLHSRHRLFPFVNMGKRGLPGLPLKPFLDHQRTKNFSPYFRFLGTAVLAILGRDITVNCGHGLLAAGERKLWGLRSRNPLCLIPGNAVLFSNLVFYVCCF